LLDAATAIFLLVCLAMLALWIRSYIATDAVERQGMRRMWQTVSSSGQIFCRTGCGFSIGGLCPT
jgi:hypothetical protein